MVDKNSQENNKHLFIIFWSPSRGDKNIQKIGRTIDMKKRLYSYATGKDSHPDIKFILIVDDPKKVEKCTKILIEKFKFKNKQELYKIDYDLLKSYIFSCANLVKSVDEKIINNNIYDTYIVYDEFEENEFLDLNNNVIGYEKLSKKSSKKSSKILSKKSSKILSKTPSKKSSKKLLKKSSKKFSKILSKKSSK